MTKQTAMFLVGLVGCAADVPDRVPEDGKSGINGARGAQGLEGSAGERGPQGPMGLPGKDAPASRWRPLGYFNCSVALDIISLQNGTPVVAKDGLRETALNYAVTIYENGDADVDCSASLGSANEGGDNLYFPALVPGAQNRRCYGRSDYPSTGATPGTQAGGWVFTTEPNPQGKYTDGDNPLNLDGLTYVFSDDDCASFIMDNVGTWSRATLAAVL